MRDKIIEIQDRGYCILREHFARPLIDACRSAFWPVLLAHLKAHGHEPNRGPHRHLVLMPFEPPCFALEFFFDNEVLSIVRGVMDDRVVADQWGCDVALPAYVLVVSFGLVRITPENGQKGRRQKAKGKRQKGGGLRRLLECVERRIASAVGWVNWWATISDEA